MTLTMPETRLIPIFDSLTHPSLVGSWLSARMALKDNSFRATTEALLGANVRWAWAVAMGDSAGYEPKAYIAACAEMEIKVLAAAYMTPSAFANQTEIMNWLRMRRIMGFSGVKLHPRLGNFGFTNPMLVDIIRLANDLEMIPFLCTYCYSARPNSGSLSLDSLQALLEKVPNAKMVLLHGGTTRLLEMAEITRHFKRMLLDVSWTMCEFAGSSLDMDLRYVFEKCSHRVCIGSDSPEFSPLFMRNRFEQLTSGLEDDVRERVAYRNLLGYSGLTELP